MYLHFVHLIIANMTHLLGCCCASLHIALGHGKPVNLESHEQTEKQHLAEEVEQKWQICGLDW